MTDQVCSACEANAVVAILPPFGDPTFRCRSCGRVQRVPAPPPKTLVYLDQMALSNIAKALDPDRLRADPTLKFWRDLFGTLDRLLKLNLLICPTSRIHEKESYVHSLGPEFEIVADHFADGISFRYPEEIQLVQLFHALDWSGPDPVDFGAIPREAVIEGNLHGWVAPIRIKANIPSFSHPPSHTKGVRDRAHSALSDIWDRWRANPRPFSERFEDELRAGADVLVEQYLSYLDACEALLKGDHGHLESVVDPSLLATILPSVSQRIAESTGNPEGAIEAALDFLRSEEALGEPYNWNSAMLVAALARKAESGQRKISKGTLNDVIAISAFAPYCDAIFMDDEMAGLLREAPLDRDFISTAEFFSNRTRDDFLTFLGGIESRADPKHLALVDELYQHTSLDPYYDLIVDNRRRGESGGPT